MTRENLVSDKHVVPIVLPNKFGIPCPDIYIESHFEKKNSKYFC